MPLELLFELNGARVTPPSRERPMAPLIFICPKSNLQTVGHRDGCAKSERILEGNAESELSSLRRGTRNPCARDIHQRRALQDATGWKRA
jgi:hypothetical protein